MSRQRIYIGIDWATEKHALCVTDAEGNIIKERSIPNDSTLFEVILGLIVGAAPYEVYVAVETRRLVLVEALVARGFKVFTINPKQSERFRDRFSVAGAKDDRFDARVLASALRTDLALFDSVEPETAQHLRLRGVTRARETLQHDLRAVANRLREVIMTSMPLLLALCPGADEPWFWELAQSAPNPTTAQSLSNEKVKELLRRHRIRRLDVEEIRKVLDGAHLEAAKGVCETASWQGRLLIQQLKLLTFQERKIEAELKAALLDLPKSEGASSDAEIVMSAPGFASLTTAVLLVEANPAVVKRDLQMLRAVGGAAPVTMSSGKKKRGKGVVVMRRAVNVRLRNALHAAGAAASRDPRFKPIYVRLRSEGASHGRAVRGVVDRLLKVVIAMLRDGKLYEPAKTQVQAS